MVLGLVTHPPLPFAPPAQPYSPYAPYAPIPTRPYGRDDADRQKEPEAPPEASERRGEPREER